MSYMGDLSDGIYAIQLFRYRRIMEMLTGGVDISVISKLAEIPPATISKLDNKLREDNEKNKRLIQFFQENQDRD